jgi:hypothetical protein
MILAVKPGFNWMQVSWGGPDEVRSDRCSYCEAVIADDDVPLIMTSKAGWLAQFCDACTDTWWTVSPG